MTYDLVVLSPRVPDPQDLVAAMTAAGKHLRVRPAPDGPLVELCDTDGRLMVSLEVPRVVQVPGEVERVLGPVGSDQVPVPVSWLELRAAADRLAVEAARAFTGALAARLDGQVWSAPDQPSPPASPVTSGPVTQVPAHPVPAEDGSVTAALTADHPVLERITGRVGVVAVDRPVVAASTAVASIMRPLAAAGLGVQLVTPARSRLTAVLYALLAEVGGDWIVREANGDLYHGLVGVPVRWDGAAFTVAGERPVPAFQYWPDHVGRQLVVFLRVTHDAAGDAIVGGAVSVLAEALTGMSPAGWGTAEPATEPWHEAELTAFARKRAPDASRLMFRGAGGRPLEGTVEITRVPAGIDEHVVAYAGYGAEEELPLDVLADIARTVARRFTLVSMLAAEAPGRRDLTHGPYATGMPTPLVLAAPGDGTCHQLGGDPEQAWRRFAELTEDLGGAR